MTDKIAAGILLGFICLMTFAVGHISFMEDYFYFSPYADTYVSKDFTEEKFNKIRVGYSEDEVLQIIGEPLSVTQNNLWHYTADGKCKKDDFAWMEYGIQFDNNGKVLKVLKYIAKD